MRRTVVLASVVIVECLLGAGGLYLRSRQPLPPWPAQHGLNRLDEAALRRQYQNACRGWASDWIELARSYAAWGFWPEAVACYEQACRQAWRAAPEWLFECGFYSGQLGRADQAVQYLERAIAEGYKDPEIVWFFVAQNQLRQENAEEAKVALRRAELLPAATYELARLYNKLGQPEQARRIIEPLTRSFRFHYAPFFVHLRAAQLLGDEDEERRAALEWLSLAYPLRSPFDDQHDELSRRLENTPYRQGLRYAHQLLSDGKLDELHAHLERLLEAEWSVEAADLMAEWATREGRVAQAEQVLRDAIQRQGATLHLLWRLGDLLFDTGRFEEAWDVWEQAAVVGRGDRELDQFLTYVMLKAEGRGEVVRGKQYDAARWLAEGRIRLARGEFQDAAGALRKATELAPGDPQAWYLLAEAARCNAQPSVAREAYQKCLLLVPHHGRAQFALGLLR
ncbi:MAG: hypothetical protein KatS3mg110_4191 [Pirellulaceae bacterium]|nr:MAG: hypothetical protein KatS3mg110_4191 [Pirellulaceae bacterium]